MSGQEGAFPGYVIFLAVVRSVGLNWSAVALTQVLGAALALCCLIDISRRLAGGLAGAIAGLIYVAHFELIEVAFFVLTDSLYTSGLVLTAYAILRATESERSARWASSALVLALGTATVRPEGWSAVAVAVAWYFLVFRTRRWTFRAMVVAGTLLFSIGLLYSGLRANLLSESPFSALAHLGTLSSHVYDGTVIWGDPTSNLTMPEPAVKHGTQLAGLAGYCLQHVLPCGQLFFRRISLALLGVRPYFSLPHNLIIAGRLIVLYGLAAIGLLTRPVDKYLGALLAIVLAHLAFIGIVWIDWDGRFMLHVVPLLAILGGLGAQSLQARAHVLEPHLRG